MEVVQEPPLLAPCAVLAEPDHVNTAVADIAADTEPVDTAVGTVADIALGRNTVCMMAGDHTAEDTAEDTAGNTAGDTAGDTAAPAADSRTVLHQDTQW